MTQMCVVAVVMLSFPSQAFAYLDPGTGSMLLQVILAGIAGIGVFCKLFWVKIRSFFYRKEPQLPINDVARQQAIADDVTKRVVSE